MKNLILFLLISSLLFGVDNNDKKQILLKKIDQEIKIDGKIDEIWAIADSVSDFHQFQPYHDTIPSVKTTAKVLTNDNSIYCLMVCYDDFENIQPFTGKLDDFGGDIVSFMIDTFGDNRTAYKFAVASGGFRNDCRLLDDGRNRDYNWDGIWFADAEVYNWGFVVEMEIPYKSIQYDETLETWGLDFDRWRPINSEDIYWCNYEESEGQRISKFGDLLLGDFKPQVSSLNLEIYPVGIAKTTLKENDKYNTDLDAGIDIFYNPSQALTFQLTANPDFAQIEADPFDFNISRYESYFAEKRPFFTEGNEVFSPSGRERNTGFYKPLELFYSRRIGKLLPDGQEVPLLLGTKAFGRIDDYEYGGFFAMTGKTNYVDEDENLTEDQAYFGSARIKKQIFDNSSLGLLFVGKHTKDNNYGVLDLDGAFRGSNWQLSYQVARSFKNDEGDYAASVGLTHFSDEWINLYRGRYIGNNFDIDEVGYVPWKGTLNIVGLSGPRWSFDEGAIRAIFLYGGGYIGWEKVDNYTDLGGLLGLNFNFRNNWGFELGLDAGKSKDENIIYNSYGANLSSWFHISPKWNGNVWGGYSNTYNFSRDYLAFYSWGGTSVNWNILSMLSIGTSLDMFIEGNPNNEVEDITYNARPYFSLTPINNLNIKMYVDNVFVKSSDKLEQVIFGFFFAYNFSPKSWIYLAINEVQDRSLRHDENNNVLERMMRVKNRAGVLKLKYLYYF